MTDVKVRRQTQVERRLESREKLINACIQLVAEEGAGALTFDAIGERSGYSRNLAFQKFGSKSELLRQVIEHLNNMVEATQQAVGLDGLPGLDAVLIYCDTQFIKHENVDVMRAYSILLGSAVSDLSEHREYFEKQHKLSESQLRKLLSKGISDGTVNPNTNVSQAALLIGSLMLGISSHSIVDSTFNIKKALRELKRVIKQSYGSDS